MNAQLAKAIKAVERQRKNPREKEKPLSPGTISAMRIIVAVDEALDRASVGAGLVPAQMPVRINRMKAIQ